MLDVEEQKMKNDFKRIPSDLNGTNFKKCGSGRCEYQFENSKK